MAEDLVLILPEFVVSEGSSGQEPAAERYPALERMLAVAQHALIRSDWRAALAERCGPGSLAGLSPARVLARAQGTAAAEQAPGCWLLTPVHYFAGLDSVHLHPDGLLRLAQAELDALAESFNREFADGSWRIWPTAHREMLLTGPRFEAAGEDPARWRGSRLERGESAARSGSADLRRLGVEVEMWLHAHPINEARERAGRMRVIGLWPWGAEPLQASPASRPPHPATLWGRDSVAESIWQLSGAPHEPAAPPRLDALDGHGSHVVLLSGAPQEPGVLETLEQCWLAPALAAIRSGSLRSLALFAGAHSFHLGRLRLVTRFWRSSAPWREALA